MMFYLIMLALGLEFVYTLRDGFMILQNRRDARLAIEQQRRAAAAAHSREPDCRPDGKLSA